MAPAMCGNSFEGPTDGQLPVDDGSAWANRCRRRGDRRLHPGVMGSRPIAGLGHVGPTDHERRWYQQRQQAQVTSP